ncbi:MAG: ABC transporter ATP-binding protein [Candidatus Heimdallarchaeota archaeon]|nr:MAG: ABC transporter ATP-binding protein [Candidatus Heimdallarchaeota archaeon]
MSNNVLIEAKNLSKEYIRGKKEVVMAVNDVDLQIPKGKLVMVTGPSGSGKSTLLNILSGLDKPSEGKVLYEDENIAEWDEEKLATFRRGNVGFIFQNWELIRIMTALENIESPLYPLKIKSKEIRMRAISLLKQVGLWDKADNYPDELSGGEQQRIGIARALVGKPRIIFADEPTGNLDQDNAASIMRLLKSFTKRDTSVLVVTHNEDLKRYADTTHRMSSGRFV